MSDEIEPIESSDDSSSSDYSYDNSYTYDNSSNRADSVSASEAVSDKVSETKDNDDAGKEPSDGLSLSKEASEIDGTKPAGESKGAKDFRDAWMSWANSDTSGEKAEKMGDSKAKESGDPGGAQKTGDREDPDRTADKRESDKTGDKKEPDKRGEEKEPDKTGDKKEPDKAGEKSDKKEPKDGDKSQDTKDSKDTKETEKEKEDKYKDQVIGLMREMVGLMSRMVQMLGGGGMDSVKASGAIDGSSKWGDLFNSWGQGKEGNCSSVATIKAAMEKYGDNVFDKVEGSASDGYKITMKDGYKVSLSPQEMQTAERMSNFGGSGESRDYAEMAYAAMGKRALEEGHEGARTYERAVHSLNNGEDPYHSAHLLGLDDHVRTVSESDLSSSTAAVGWSDTHAVFVGRGYTDGYGDGMYYDGTDTNGKWLTGGFIFV